MSKLTTSWKKSPRLKLNSGKSEIESEIRELDSKFNLQLKENSPLRFLTGIRLHLKRGQKFSDQHMYEKAISEFINSISFSEKRIKELLSHEGARVGDVSKGELIKNSKDYIRHNIFKISYTTFLKSDLINLGVADIMSSLSSHLTHEVRSLKTQDVVADVQRAALAYTEDNPRFFMDGSENLKYVLNKSNFSLVDGGIAARNYISIYQNLVKEIRSNAFEDVEVANKCAYYREKSAELYRLIGDQENYYEEISSSLLYRVYSSTTLDEFERLYSNLEDTLSSWESRKRLKYSSPFHYRAQASIFGLKFIDDNDIRTKIKNIKLINYYLRSAKSALLNLYTMYENYYVLVESVFKSKRMDEIKLPYQKRFTFPDSVKPEVQEIKNTYRDLVKLIQYLAKKKDLSSPLGHPHLSSVLTLYDAGIIDTDTSLNLLKTILHRIMGEETSLQLVLNEEHDQNILTDMLRNGETTEIEVKKSFADNEKIGRAISAFSNTKGGKIIIGLDEIKSGKQVDETGHRINEFMLVGLGGDIDSQKRKLTGHLNSCGINVSQLVIDISLEIDEKRVCIIEVQPLTPTSKLVFYLNEAYKRVDSQNIKMSGKEIIEFSRYS